MPLGVRAVRVYSETSLSSTGGCVISRTRLVAFAAGALALAGAGVAAGWALDDGARDRSAVLARRLGDVSARASAAAAERDRIKADRDRLEAQIAAQSAPPKVCPQETISTAQAQLLARFTVEYPCGWHVLEDPLQSFAEDAGDRHGRMLDQIFFSVLPISRAPREGPLTDITLDTWYDDPNAEGDALPPFDDWLASAKRRFTSVAEATVRTRTGASIVRLSGSMTPFDRPQQAVLYVWEWTDGDGARRISEAFALEPGPILTRTLAALVRSFRVLGA